MLNVLKIKGQLININENDETYKPKLVCHLYLEILDN